MMPCSEASRPTRANSASTAASSSARNARKPCEQRLVESRGGGERRGPGDGRVEEQHQRGRSSVERDDAPARRPWGCPWPGRATPPPRAAAPRCRGRTRSRTAARTGSPTAPNGRNSRVAFGRARCRTGARSRPSRSRTRRSRRTADHADRDERDDQGEAESDRCAERVQSDEERRRGSTHQTGAGRRDSR